MHALLNYTWYQYSVPSSAPENVSGIAVDSKSIHIGWNPPLQAFQNGEIRGYLIFVTEIETGDVFNFNTSLTMFRVESLHPYYYYEVEIGAVTVDSGPLSTPIIIQTLEDSRLFNKT